MMTRIIEVLRDAKQRQTVGQQLYFVAFIFGLVITFLQTTTFIQFVSNHALTRLIYISLALLVAKLLCFDDHDIRQLLLDLVMMALLGCSWYLSQSLPMITMGLFVITARNIDFHQIVQTYLTVGLIIFAVVIVSALVGIIPNIIFHRQDVVRLSFGIIYTTDFAAHVLSLVMAYCYLNFSKLNWRYYCCIVLIAIFIMKVCDARLDTACLLLIIPVIWFAQQAQRGNRGAQLVTKFYWGVTPIMAYATVMMAWLFNNQKNWMLRLDQLVSGRLTISHQALGKYGISWFGQHLTERGWGFGAAHVNDQNYFFIDSSFMRMVIISGLVLGIIVVFWMTKISWQSIQAEDYALAAIIVILTISAMVEQHLLEIDYDPFLLAAYSIVYTSDRQSRMEKKNIE
ncbi:hypothetical protein [Limosilactobacillus sp.]|uniref:hypothetical protein n=1 Tax=Limosilactobacillus sp. TaxID=2773925 RepID=UPI00345EDF3D